jgi:hypothetical protein
MSCFVIHSGALFVASDAWETRQLRMEEGAAKRMRKRWERRGQKLAVFCLWRSVCLTRYGKSQMSYEAWEISCN